MFQSMDPQQAALAIEHPFSAVEKGTEFIRHFKQVGNFKSCEQYYIDTRDWFVQRSLAGQLTSFFVVWGLTGSGKLLALSNFSLLLQKDPVIQKRFAEHGISEWTQVCTHFSSSANLAKARPGDLIDPSHGHGQYTDSEYRAASVVHTEYTLRYFNNHEKPILVSTEPSGPTVYFEPDGTMKGTDRAASTIKILAEKFRDDTKILVIIRGAGVVDRILSFRGNLLESPWQDIPDVAEDAHLKFSRSGEILDPRKMQRPALLRIKEQLTDSMAPPKGVVRSNDQTFHIMEKVYGTKKEEEFWPQYLRDLGFTDFTLVRNEVSNDDYVLNLDLIEKYDPMLPDIEALKKPSKQPLIKKFFSLFK